MKKGIAILLYVFLMAVFFGFDFWKLFHIRQIFFVVLGAVFLYLPSVFEQKKEGKRISFDGDFFGQNALWASLIEFFILVFTALSSGKKLQYLTPELAFACRPVLYGFCIWLIFQGERKEERGKKREQKETILEENAAIEETEKSTLEKMEMLGLTKRECEVALLILKDFSNAEIAAELFISETTVKKHVTNIFGKTGIKARGELKKIL